MMKMKRRSFLKGLLGLAAFPVIAALPDPKPVDKNPLLSGEIGRIEGFRFIESPKDDLINEIIAMGKQLDAANVPYKNRYVWQLNNQNKWYEKHNHA